VRCGGGWKRIHGSAIEALPTETGSNKLGQTFGTPRQSSTRPVLTASEVPINVQAADAGCFAITSKEQLKEGEYGFSPTGEEYAFTFGVGEVERHK
jgi:hypothetical protein